MRPRGLGAQLDSLLFNDDSQVQLGVDIGFRSCTGVGAVKLSHDLTRSQNRLRGPVRVQFSCFRFRHLVVEGVRLALLEDTPQTQLRALRVYGFRV